MVVEKGMGASCVEYIYIERASGIEEKRFNRKRERVIRNVRNDAKRIRRMR